MLTWLLWPVQYFGKLLQYASDNSSGIGLVIGALSFLTGFIPNLISSGMAYIAQRLTLLAIGELGNVNLAALDYVAYANAILPITEFVYLMGVYLVAWLVVISIRWVKSLIPTVSN